MFFQKHLLCPILQGIWIFPLLPHLSIHVGMVVEGNFRNKTQKNWRPATIVRWCFDDLLHLQKYWSCRIEYVPAVMGRNWKESSLHPPLWAAGTKLLLQGYEKPYWRICLFQGGLVLMINAISKCYGLYTGAVGREKSSFLISSLSPPNFACELQYSVSSRCFIWQRATTSSVCSYS